MKNKIRLTVLLVAVLLLSTILVTACASGGGNADLSERVEDFLDAILTGDKTAAYALVRSSCSEEEFDSLFSEFCEYLDGISDYELKQVGWRYNLDNGVETVSATYELSGDNGTLYVISAAMVEGVEGLSGFHVQDTAEILEMQKSFRGLDLILKVYSVLVLAFGVWMLVDCIKRKLRRKWLWILLILVGVLFKVTIGATQLHLNFNIGFWFTFSGVSADIYGNAVIAKLMIPVGSVIYFFLRKQKTLQEDEPHSQNEIIIEE